VKSRLKGREHDQPLRSRGTSSAEKPPVFILADRSPGERYVIPSKDADESTIRLLLANRQQESLTVYTDGFRAYEPLEEDDAFSREYVVHGDGEYVDEDVHVNTYGSQNRASNPGSRPIEASPRINPRRISERFSFAVVSTENQGKRH
jgi:transposase